MFKFKFQLWEKVVISSATLVFLLSFGIYLTDFPIRKYIFNLAEEDGLVLIGHVTQKDGSLKRQLLGESEFKQIEPNTPLYNMDVIVTGPDSTASLKLDSEGSVEIGPNTMVRLAFQSNFALDGIDRVDKLDVISGKVTGQAGKRKIVIMSKSGEKVVKPNTLETIVVKNVPIRPVFTPPPIVYKAPTPQATSAPVAQNLAPPPALPSPEPSPTPTISKEQMEKTKITYPQRGERLAIREPNPKPEKTVKLTWNIFPPEQKTLVRIWRVKSNQGKKDREKVLDKVFPVQKGQGGILWKAKHPGFYEWEIAGPEGQELSYEQNTHSSFYIEPEFEGIKPLSPLVGGKAAASNQLQDQLLSQFDISLRWEPYPSVKAYNIQFLPSAHAKQPTLEKTVEKPEFAFNKDKIFNGQIYYKVRSQLENGFIVTSSVQTFSFTFLPPALVVPENNSVLTLQRLKDEGNRILLTWQKTNFTIGYEIEVAKDPEFKQTYVKKTLKENYLILPRPPLGQYWWRARSFTKELSSPMSVIYQFTVAP